MEIELRVYWGIALSLILHFLLYGGLRIVPAHLLKTPPQSIEIEVVDSAKLQPELPPQFVREQEVAKRLLDIDNNKQAPFKSAQTIRVKEQTRAAQVGMTKNRSLRDLTQITQKKSISTSQTNTPKQTPLNSDDILQKKSMQKEQDNLLGKELEKALARDRIKAELEKGLSTVGEELPQDIRIGNMTALNTDRYLYYSFYARVEELIRFRWESMVEETIQNLNPRNLNSQNRIWTTYMEVTLKPNGEFVRAAVMKESGIKGFDISAVKAFADAGLFPNPPHEMVKQDGLIHLKYGFNVHYNPRPFVQK